MPMYDCIMHLILRPLFVPQCGTSVCYSLQSDMKFTCEWYTVYKHGCIMHLRPLRVLQYGVMCSLFIPSANTAVVLYVQVKH